MPEMSVVRFTESDVIVASILFSNFNDGEASTATITVDGTKVYDASQGSSSRDWINTYFPFSGNRYVIPANSSTPSDRLLLTSLLDVETTENPDQPRYDGSYTWNSATGEFIHQ